MDNFVLINKENERASFFLKNTFTFYCFLSGYLRCHFCKKPGLRVAMKDATTEQHIRETAKRLFLTEGRLMATTQDIADAAGVNRTLLPYYFRSRDALFELVFREALTRLRQRLHGVIGSDLLFRRKIEELVEVFHEEPGRLTGNFYRFAA